jgi:hypothetical protein
MSHITQTSSYGVTQLLWTHQAAFRRYGVFATFFKISKNIFQLGRYEESFHAPLRSVRFCSFIDCQRTTNSVCNQNFHLMFLISLRCLKININAVFIYLLFFGSLHFCFSFILLLPVRAPNSSHLFLFAENIFSKNIRFFCFVCWKSGRYCALTKKCCYTGQYGTKCLCVCIY